MDVNSLEKQQKEELYCLVELMSKLIRLKQKASRGKLNQQDLQVLEQTHQVVLKYHRSIVQILQTNNDNSNCDREWIP